MKLIRIHALALLVVFTMALPGKAREEIWGCVKQGDDHQPTQPHLIDLVAKFEEEFGAIRYDDLPMFPTKFGVGSTSREWWWPDNLDSRIGHIFMIENNIGYYAIADRDSGEINSDSLRLYDCHRHLKKP